MRAAARRETVYLRRRGRMEPVILLYWPGDSPRRGRSTKWRAKVQTTSGAVFCVKVGHVALTETDDIE